MTPNETKRLLDAVAAACPTQRINDAMADSWRRLLSDLKLTDCLVAVESLAQQGAIQPRDIRSEVDLYRARSEPGGEIYREALARRGGKEYTGGPVCWDAANCEGICRECRALGGATS